MRNLPLIPYDTLRTLINGSFTSKQIDYFINLCRICNSNGVIKEKSMNSVINKIDIYTSSRATGYRAINRFIDNNLLFINEEGDIEIKGYKEGFKKGSKGIVVIPMFCFSMEFKKLSKIEKRIALYLIGQIRKLNKIKYFTVNINKMVDLFGICFSYIHSAFDNIKTFFYFSFFHNQTVCRANYKHEYLLSEFILEDMTTDFKENHEHSEKGEEIISLIYSKDIDKLLLDRKKSLYIEELNKYIVSKKEVDVENNINIILNNLYKYSYKEIVHILDLLASKLRQFSDPIMHFNAYLKTLIEESI
ncbi:hypothetical protein [Tepidibacter aestuarii]|uniref:hypothetical protein n=1 Tax=Tepidibacter aestuarii TaxID=2925782 RepID=UPI0020BF2030|nr:hypothetical protein [Tepidibacter aestuarii]CAH2215072.1 protein of unknown function [Tepidibacter aestuarii]